MKISPANIRVLAAILLTLLWNTQTLLVRAAVSDGPDESRSESGGASRRGSYEVVTHETTYATRDGISIAAKPSFKIAVKSLDNPESWNPRARGRVMEMYLNEHRKRATPDEFKVNFAAFDATYHSGDEPVPDSEGDKSTRIPKLTLFAASAAITLIAPETLLARIGVLGVNIIGAINPLTDIVEAENVVAEQKAAGRVVLIGSDGRLYPTRYLASPNDCKGARCLGGYIYRDIVTPGKTSLLGAYVAGVIGGERVTKVFPSNPYVEIPLGEFASSLVEDGLISGGQYGHYDAYTQKWMPSQLTVSLQNIPPVPQLQIVPERRAPVIIQVPPSAQTSTPTAIIPAMPQPVAVTTYRTAPSAATAVSVSSSMPTPASISPVNTAVTVTTTSNVPSISSSTRSNIPTSISPGNGFGQYTLHY